jgi:hypothetical protein
MVSRRASTPGAAARMDARRFLLSILKYTMAERNSGRYILRMQTTNVNSASVAVFGDHKEAENAIKALQQGGFDFHKLSIVGADYHSDEDVVGYYNNGDRMLAWGRNGAFWGGIWGLFVGAAFFVVPGIGPLLVAGPLVAAIVGALEGAAVVGTISAAGAGLIGLGIPKDSVIQYDTALKAGKYLVVAHGSNADAERARDILAHAGIGMPTLHANN